MCCWAGYSLFDKIFALLATALLCSTTLLGARFLLFRTIFCELVAISSQSDTIRQIDLVVTGRSRYTQLLDLCILQIRLLFDCIAHLPR